MNLATPLLPLLLILSACSPKPAVPLPSIGEYFSSVNIGADMVGKGKVQKVEGTAVTLVVSEGARAWHKKEIFHTIDWMSVTLTSKYG